MSIPLYELCGDIRKDPQFAQCFSKGQVKRVTMSKEAMAVSIHCVFEKPLSPEQKKSLTKYLKKVFPGLKTGLFLCFDKNSISDETIWDIVNGFHEDVRPVSAFLNGAQIICEGSSVKFAVNGGSAMLKEMGFESKLKEYIFEHSGANVDVRLVVAVPLDEKKILQEIEKKAQEHEKIHQKEKSRGAKGRKIELPKYKNLNITDKSPELLFGTSRFGKEITKLSDLTEATDSCTIYGKVFDCDVRKFPRISVFSAKITDGTSSVLLKYAVRHGEILGGLAKIEKGDCLVVQGRYLIDNFLNCPIIEPNNIALVEEKKLIDIADVKRVELHLHTKLSALDAICDPGGIVREAARIGHRAVAITDHGVVQAFPEAMLACRAIRKSNPDFKLIYGVEGYFVDDSVLVYTGDKDLPIAETEVVIFDIETTGLIFSADRITQIGAVVIGAGAKGETFDTFVNPEKPIPPKITELTGIRDDMVANAPTQAEAVKSFLEFANGRILVAHNAHSFDMQFLAVAAKNAGIEKMLPPAIDTLPLAHKLYRGLKSYKLNKLSKYLGCKSFNHHRALDDAMALADVYSKMMETMQKENIVCLQQMNEGTGDVQSKQSHHIIILTKSTAGLKNLYKLISESHINNYAYGRSSGPRIPRSMLNKYREGLIVGSACEAGELYKAVSAGKTDEALGKIAEYYDYLEIQPLGNNEFMIRKGIVESEEELKQFNKKIIEIGKKLDIPVLATGDVHFPRPEDAIYRAVLQGGQGYDDFNNQAPLYLRTTQEMLDEFSYLPKELAYEIVVENTNKIADMVEPDIQAIPSGTFTPTIEGSDEQLRESTMQYARQKYGDPLPELIESRIEKELDSIIKHGYSVLYVIAQKLVKYSEQNGYLVGSRGSVGSSAVAFFAGISEVNPLPPHYLCPECKHSVFTEDVSMASGFDLPEETCPKCGTKMLGDGNEIPFETFLGFDGDKEPDIDLNFSGEFQSQAHKYTEELFGKEYVFKAGTVSGLQEKTAFGYVKKYLEKSEKTCDRVEIDRLVSGIAGTKRTTGQHPGGMIVVPAGYEIEDFCPIQHPADDKEKGVVTTHFEFKYLHDTLLKLDELGHDNPTKYKYLEEYTSVKMEEVPMNDQRVISLLVSTKALGVTPEDIDSQTGTFAIPELGTNFVRQMLIEAKPKSFGDLIQISGLSHGTDVWTGNAQELIKDNICTISDVIGTRDSIMTYLVHKGVEPKLAFDVMEQVRKGIVAKIGFSAGIEDTLKEHGVPQWYIDSCKKIKYMFPKAHAVAYLIAAMRMMWFKLEYPQAFYATEFTVRGEALDYEAAMGDKGIAKRKMLELKNIKKEEKTAKDEENLTVMQIVNEYRARGYEFLPICFGNSHAKKYTIEGEKENKKIRLPFLALRGIGETAAASLEKATISGQRYLSIEELRTATNISTTVVEALRGAGVLAGLPESNQLSFF